MKKILWKPPRLRIGEGTEGERHATRRSGVEIGGYQEIEAEADKYGDGGNCHEFHMFMFYHCSSPLMGVWPDASRYGPSTRPGQA
jgi:hypothetical protein